MTTIFTVLLLAVLVTCVHCVQCIRNSHFTGPSPYWPQQLNDVTGWMEYVLFVGLVVLSPMVFFVFFYHAAFYFWCCRRCCQACGGSVSTEINISDLFGYDESSKSEKISFSSGAKRYKVIIGCFFSWLFILFILTAAVTSMSSVTMFQLERNSISLVSTAADRANSALTTVNDIPNTVNSTYIEVNGILDAMDGLNTALNKINKSVSYTYKDVNLINETLNNMTNELNQIRSILQNLSSNADLHDVPHLDAIPSIQLAQNALENSKTTLTNSENDVLGGKSEIQNVRNEVKKKIGKYMNDISIELNKFKINAYPFLNKTHGLLEFTNSKVDKGGRYFKIGNISYASIAGTFYLIIFLNLTIAMLAILYCGYNACVKYTAAFAFFSAAIFVLIGAFYLTISLGMFNTCKEAEPALLRSQSLVDQLLSHTNININVTILVNNIFHCKSNDSILDLFPGISLSPIDSSALIEEIDNVRSIVINSPHIQQLSNALLNDIDQFEMIFKNIELNVSKPLTSLEISLESVELQLNNMTQFGYNQTAVMESLAELNAKSQKIGGRNNFTLDTINELNPMASPYNQDEQYFSNQKNLLLQYKDDRDQAIRNINEIEQQLRMINTSISIIFNELHNITIIQSENISEDLDTIKDNINSLIYTFEHLKSVTLLAFSCCKNAIESLTNAIANATSCTYIGTYFRDASSRICYELTPYIASLSLLSYIVAISLLLFFMCLLPATKRIGYDWRAPNEFEEEQSLLSRSNTYRSNFYNIASEQGANSVNTLQ